MRAFILFIFLFFAVVPAFTQETPKRQKFEVTIGPDLLIYQSAYSLQNTYGLEAAVGGKITGALEWQGGLRLGLDPVLPEGFARVMVKQSLGPWQPAIGIELGITARTYFEEGDNLLKETREAMQTDINSVYFSGHASPAKFILKNGWTLSALELDLGTHLSHFGRTLRVRLGLFSIGKRF